MKKLIYTAIIFCFIIVPLLLCESIHIVKSGETPYGIARKYNIPVNDLLSFNGIDDPEELMIGTELKIPFLYEVVKGDTLFRIARINDTTVDELRRINNLTENSIIKVGDILTLPGFFENLSLNNEEDNSTPINVYTTTTYAKNFWPHQGVKTSLTGKLEGVQIAGERGDPVVSVSTGKVVLVQPYRGYGKMVMVETVGDYIFGYAGNENTVVKVGDTVVPGTIIGNLGTRTHDGNASVFFFVFKNGQSVDIEKAPRI